MQAIAAETGLTITNPLVLYRTLLATKQIEADPAQHRLALHLQKLYYRLKDYEPTIEYRQRLDQVTRAVGPSSTPSNPRQTASQAAEVLPDEGARRLPSASPKWLRSLQRLGNRQSRTAEDPEALALTRTLSSHEAALQMNSPQGLLLYGEVGTGKSFLVDLLAKSLPNSKKRRYHFNSFMLDTLARLERQRNLRNDYRSSRLAASGSATHPSPGMTFNGSLTTLMDQEHTLLSVARDLITASPILFLDEFQLPDRAASKILSGLFTSFFQLGGVLIATSNRMPEELSKAAGAEFTVAPPTSFSGGKLGLSGLWSIFGLQQERHGGGLSSSNSEFAQFVDVLKARCETWNMESTTDFRRRDSSFSLSSGSVLYTSDKTMDEASGGATLSSASPVARSIVSLDPKSTTTFEHGETHPPGFHLTVDAEPAEMIQRNMDDSWQDKISEAVTASLTAAENISWQGKSLTVYGRCLSIPKAYDTSCMWTFEELCGSYLGPADYITIASTFSTVIIDQVPVLNLAQKNEARRFITLLDALYEARCRLLIRAAAGPDELFFPDARGLNCKAEPGGGDGSKMTTEHPGAHDISDGGVYAETLAEIYQDQTAPFRPNISTYRDDAPPDAHYTNHASQRYAGGAHPAVPSILASEDADFGPVYGAGRSAGASTFDPAEEDRRRHVAAAGAAASSYSDPHTQGHEQQVPAGPNFQRASAFTGEDEKFAYKRAESRLWELCSRRWWASAATDPGWWRPLSPDARSWETHATMTSVPGSTMPATASPGRRGAAAGDAGGVGEQGHHSRSGNYSGAIINNSGGSSGSSSDREPNDDSSSQSRLFRHGASPFRTHAEPPPQIPWTHTWGLMRWGKKAGTWGKGTDGLNERQAEKQREQEKERENNEKQHKELMDRIKTRPRS